MSAHSHSYAVAGRGLRLGLGHLIALTLLFLVPLDGLADGARNRSGSWVGRGSIGRTKVHNLGPTPNW